MPHMSGLRPGSENIMFSSLIHLYFLKWNSTGEKNEERDLLYLPVRQEQAGSWVVSAADNTDQQIDK